jgi:hypothetical protein
MVGVCDDAAVAVEVEEVIAGIAAVLSDRDAAGPSCSPPRTLASW